MESAGFSSGVLSGCITGQGGDRGGQGKGPKPARVRLNYGDLVPLCRRCTGDGYLSGLIGIRSWVRGGDGLDYSRHRDDGWQRNVSLGNRW